MFSSAKFLVMYCTRYICFKHYVLNTCVVLFNGDVVGANVFSFNSFADYCHTKYGSFWNAYFIFKLFENTMLLKETELALWRVFLAHLYHKSIVLRCACNLLKAYSVGIQLISAGPFVCMLPKAAQVHVHRSGMISAYDLYELFMYGVVCHFTLH